MDHLMHSTTLARVYNKLEIRAELDKHRHDPWTAELSDLFNDKSYILAMPDIHDAVTLDVLAGFDPISHPHERFERL